MVLRAGVLFWLIACAQGQARPKLDGKIVGGREASIQEFPYQASLQLYGSHICGAAIIRPKYVITAAHCTDGIYQPSYMRVRVGSTYHAYGGTLHQVRSIHQNPYFNINTMDYDVTVLELETPITINYAAQPVNLVSNGFVTPNGAQCVVSGWGYLSEGGTTPSKLQAVFLPIVDRYTCSRSYSSFRLTDNMICAGNMEGGKDSCQGDSGGPLVYYGQLVGIVSWGYGCARPRYPGIYTNVARMRLFVDSIVR